MKLSATNAFGITGFVFRSSSCSLETGEHNVSETAYFSTSHRGEAHSVKSIRRANFNSCTTHTKFKLFGTDGGSASSSLCRSPFWGPWPDFNFLCLTITFFLNYVGRPVWREDESAVCSAITQWSESSRTRNHTLLSHPRLPQPRGPDSGTHIPFLSPLLIRRVIVEVF
jgi:hypothetical protein